MTAVSDLSAVWTPLPGTSQEIALDTRCQHTLYCGSRGPGKCLPVDTLVPTPSGWVPHGSLTAGAFVFGSTGEPVRVTQAFDKIERDVYRIVFNDTSTIDASDNHLWTVSYDYGVPRNWRTVETSEIVARAAKGYPIRLPARPAVAYAAVALPIDPYILGAWVGDGSTSMRIRRPTGNRTKTRKGYAIEFGSMDSELVDAFVAADFKVRRVANGFTWLNGKLHHRQALAELGLATAKSHNKFIPAAILQNDIKTRIAFLQGLADTDGTPRKSTGTRISTVSPQLARDIVSLVQSLGGVARVGTYKTKEVDKQHYQVIHNVDFSLQKHDVPFRLSRKIARFKAPERMGWFCLKVVKTLPLGKQLVSCVEVDAPDHLYVAGRDYIVTHNSDTQLMRFRRRVGIGYGAFWRGIILDREHKNLDDLIVKAKRWFLQFNDGCEFMSATNAYKFVWPTGEELLFRTAKKEEDYWNYHGQEFPFMAWNELTKYPTGKLYDMFMSCNRSSWTQEKNAVVDRKTGAFTLPPIPLEVFSTTNPWGAGHAWVKAAFIDPAPYGVVLRKTFNVFDPGTQAQVDVVRTQVAIFGSYKENRYLSPVYVATLEAEKDPNLRKAWLEGSWDVAVGGMFSDVWQPNTHILPRFKVPLNWRIDRSFDWGSTHPFWVGWWAEANGEEVEVQYRDGTTATFCPPARSFILVHELYGTTALGTNTGVKWSAPKIAEQIVAIEQQLKEQHWIGTKVAPGPADNQIRETRESDVQTIEKKMAERGVKWTRSDKSKGSRIIGAQLMRDRLEASSEKSGPGVYVMEHNRASISLIPILPRDEKNPDDVDTDSEDHAWDGWRYKLLAPTKRFATGLTVGFARAK